MFTILKHLHFYSSDNVRGKMTEVHGIVRRDLSRVIDTSQRKRSDILVSYLDGPAKSGAHFARLYVDEAKILVDNVVERSKLLETLNTRTDIRAVLFIDDFVGTGHQASGNLKEIDAVIGPLIVQRGIKVVFAAVVAFIQGWRYLERIIDELSMPIQLHACEILDETSQCFGDNSEAFADEVQKEFARNLAYTTGKILERDCPLGYGGLELAVVFERGCPNDSLPILWSESGKWIPLFKRH